MYGLSWIRGFFYLVRQEDILLVMPDIAMCFGKDCPLKEECVRYLSESDGIDQTYFIESPYRNGSCKFFWKVR